MEHIDGSIVCHDLFDVGKSIKKEIMALFRQWVDF
jgi:hypothetical protein